MKRMPSNRLLLILPIAQSIFLAVIANLISARLSVPIALTFFIILTLGIAIYLWLELKTLDKMGIVAIETSMSAGTDVRQCIKQTQTSLAFLGVAGTKWRQEKKEMDEMFQRIFLHHGTVRFLLLDPDSNAAANFASSKDIELEDIKRDISQIVDYFRSKQAAGARVQVRFYDFLPNWRITMVDDALVVLGSYSLTAIDGKESPQLVLGNQSPWSFSRCAKGTFETEWLRAKVVL